MGTNKSIWFLSLDTSPIVSSPTRPPLEQDAPLIKDLRLATLLSRVYYNVDNDDNPIVIDELIARFFILPAALAGTIKSSQLEYIGPCAEYLVGNLSWLSGLVTITPDAPLDETALTAYIDSYLIKAPETIFKCFLNTLMAYAMLDTLLEVVKADPETIGLVLKLERIKDVCSLFLSNPSIIFQKIEQYFILYVLLRSLNNREKINPIIAQNPYFDVIKKNLHIVCCYPISIYAKLISNLLSTLSQPNGDIVFAINELALNPQKPLLHIARFSFQILLDIINRLMASEYPDKIKYTFLSLLISSIKPPLEEAQSRIREDFLIFVYNHYALDKSKHRNLIFKMLANVYLSEENLCLLSDPAWSDELLYLSDDFGFMFAFCLSRAACYPQKYKEQLFYSVMQITNPSAGIVVNWFAVLRKFDLDFGIRKHFFSFFPRVSFYKKEEVTALFAYFDNLILRYQGTQPVVLKDPTDLELISRWFLSLIALIPTKELPLLLKAMLETHESSNRALVLFFIGTEPLSEVLQLKDHGTIAHYEIGYLKEITIPPTLERSLAALSSDMSILKIKLLLMFLVFISRTTVNPILPNQKKWENWILSLVNRIVIIEKDSLLEKTTSRFIELLDVKNFLPGEHKKSFLAAIQPPPSGVDSATARGDALIAELEKETAKNKKNTPKPQKAPVLTVAATPIKKQDPTPSPKISAIKESPKKSGDKPILSSPVKQHATTLVNTSASSIPKPSLPKQIVEPKISHFKLPYLRDLTKELNKMEPIKLPPKFQECVSLVRTQLNLLVDNLELPAQPQAAATKSKIDYTELVREEKLEIEKSWNEVLARFSASLQTELTSYTAQKPQQEAIIAMIKASLIELSFCYFKNPELHLDIETLHLVEILNQFCKSRGYQIAIKGSYFCAPHKAHDLDLLITPKPDHLPKEKKDLPLISDEVHHLCLKAKIAIRQDRLDNRGLDIIQKIHVVFPNQHELDVDWIISSIPCPPELELNHTARAHFSCGAVHWYLDGHAVMLPRVAGANCCPKPSLVYLPDGELADSLDHIGLLLKFLIKFETIRPEPRIKQFLDQYINPETRDASLLATVETKGFIQHKLGVMTGLEYLLNRLPIRTTQTISYILDKKLFMLLFAIAPDAYQSCERYFNDHFMRLDHPKALSKISSSGFLAIFFLGIFIDKQQADREAVFSILEDAKNACEKMPSLSKIIHNTLLILKSFPTTSAVLAKAFVPRTPSESFIEKSLRDIFELWQTNQQAKKSSSYQPLWFNTPPLSTETSVKQKPSLF